MPGKPRGFWPACLAAAVLWLSAAAPAWALTAQEVIELKKAGVSDEVIQKMLDQEAAGANQTGPVQEDSGSITYKAGPSKEQVQQNAEHERWKEEKSMDAVGNVIIDTRRPPR
ncbi:MAG: hypothetical protein KQJ78_09390 [Deltaproteobacteria bacterium]|nr:hypothetical protein [Deltaproteobacteria bacterium]